MKVIGSTNFNPVGVIAALILTLIPWSGAFATGFPVYCFGCEDSTRGAAKLIGNQINLQTKALVEVLDGVTITRNNFEVARAAAESQKENAKIYDPNLGGIPRDACAIAGIAKSKTTSRNKKKIEGYNLAVGAKIDGESTSEIAPTDDSELYTAERTVNSALLQDAVIRRVATGQIPGSVGVAVMADAMNGAVTIGDSGTELPNGKSAYETALQLEWQRLDPNPPPLNPALKVEGATPSDAGSPTALKEHARNVAYNNTNEVAKAIVNDILRDRKNTLSADMAIRLADANGFDYSDQVVDGKISSAAMRYLLNTYRINSTGEFLAQNDTGAPVTLARLSNKMFAQSLSNEEEIIQKLEQGNRAQAHIISLLNQIKYLMQNKETALN